MNNQSIVIVPGFGMDGSLHAASVVAQSGRNRGCIPIVPLGPMILPSIHAQASQLEKYLVNMQRNSDILILFGFSTGADVVMQLIAQQKLDLPATTMVVLLEPNLGPETCTITRLASEEKKFDDFVNGLRKVAFEGEDADERDMWMKYFTALRSNASIYDILHMLGNDVFENANDRFDKFLKEVDLQTGKIAFTGQSIQVHLCASENTSIALKRHFPDGVPQKVQLHNAPHFKLYNRKFIHDFVNRQLTLAGL